MTDPWANNAKLKRLFKTAREVVREEAEAARTGKCPKCNGAGQFYYPRDLHRSGGNVPCGHFTDKGYCAKGKWVLR